MPILKCFSSLTTILITCLFSSIFVPQAHCTANAVLKPSKSLDNTSLAKPVQISKPITSPNRAPVKDNVVIQVKPDPCSLQYVSVGLPTTGNFDQAPEGDDGTFNSNIRYGEDAVPFSSSSTSTKSSSNSIFSESNPNNFLVYPTSVRVPLCTGVCGRTGLEARLHVCLPTGSVIQEVTQVAQVLEAKFENNQKNSSSSSSFSSSVRMGSRKLKVMLHTGCRCACRSNLEESCPLPEVQRFNRDRCRCECSNYDPGCTKRRSSWGAMFWDETICQCRCPHFLSSYVRLMPPPKFPCPLPSFTLDPVTCQCVYRGTSSNKTSNN